MNILRYSLFGIAGGQEVDHTFVKFIIYSLRMIALSTSGDVEYTPSASRDVLFQGRWRCAGVNLIETSIFLIPIPI